MINIPIFAFDPVDEVRAQSNPSDLPDFIIDSITLNSSEFIEGKDVESAVTVSNIEPYSATTNVNIELQKYNGTSWNTEQTQTETFSSSGDDSSTYSFQFTPQTGPYRVRAIADPDDNVEENNETNNLDTNNLDVPFYGITYGNAKEVAELSDSQDQVFHQFEKEDITGTVYYVDSDASFSFNNVKPLSNYSELVKADEALNSTAYKDAIKHEWGNTTRTIGSGGGSGDGSGSGGGGDSTTDPDKPSADSVYTITDNANLEKTFEIDQGYDPLWDFGDGTTSTDYYVTHQYPSEGEYTVTLNITIDGTEYQYTETVEARQFSEGPNKPPRDEILLVSNPDYTGQKVRVFQVGDGYNPFWDFDDDTTSTSYYIEKQFPSNGTYSVTLEITISATRYQYVKDVTIGTVDDGDGGGGSGDGSGDGGTTDGEIERTGCFLIVGAENCNVPVSNSTKNSSFDTGILYAGDKNYQKQDPLLFIADIVDSQKGKYGTYDYEAKIPSTLSVNQGPTKKLDVYMEIS